MPLNEMIVAAVTNFSGTTTPDKNGEAPVMLQCIAGIMPNRNVLSGTVAMRAGFEVGKTYLVNIRENGYDDTYGPDYTYIKIMELNSGLDIVKACRELGEPKVLFVQRPEGFEEVYQRKGDAVESYRSIRIREGKYHPAQQTTISDHSTAREVTIGSSTDSGGTLTRELSGRRTSDGRKHGSKTPGRDDMDLESGKLGGHSYKGRVEDIANEGEDVFPEPEFENEFDEEHEDENVTNEQNQQRSLRDEIEDEEAQNNQNQNASNQNQGDQNQRNQQPPRKTGNQRTGRQNNNRGNNP